MSWFKENQLKTVQIVHGYDKNYESEAQMTDV